MTELFSNGQHDDLGSGLFRTTLGLKPVNYLSGNTYLPIVNNWVDGDQDSPHIVNTSALRVRADGVGRRNLYPIPGNDAVYISVGRPWYQPSTWQVAPMNALTRANNRLQSINANYNLYLDHAGHFAKLGILLKGGFVPPNSRFAFPVSLVGLTRTGNTLYHNGQPVMVLRRPVVYDFANPDDVRDITFNFGAFGSQTGVIFNLPDMTGMSQPLVDPTLTLQPDGTAGIDTWVNRASADTNSGASTTLTLRQSNGTSAGIGLLKYDLSSIPPTALATAGTLDLWNDNVQATASASTLHRILAANSTWTEDGATWNYALATTTRWAGDAAANGGADAGCSVSGTDHAAANLGSFTLGNSAPAGTQHSITLVVSELQIMLTANYGMAAKTAADLAYRIRTSDHVTAANRPKLVVEHTLPAGRRLFTAAYPGIFG